MEIVDQVSVVRLLRVSHDAAHLQVARASQRAVTALLIVLTISSVSPRMVGIVLLPLALMTKIALQIRSALPSLVCKPVLNGAIQIKTVVAQT
jgi:hypothetical protein